jgi:hypothetical protein
MWCGKKSVVVSLVAVCCFEVCCVEVLRGLGPLTEAAG